MTPLLPLLEAATMVTSWSVATDDYLSSRGTTAYQGSTAAWQFLVLAFPAGREAGRDYEAGWDGTAVGIIEGRPTIIHIPRETARAIFEMANKKTK